MGNENKTMKKSGVLFVEDNLEQIDVLKSVKDSLEQKYNIEISIAKTFQEYKSATKDKDFDVVLTDLFIPYSASEDNTSKSIELFKEIFDEIKTGIQYKDGTVVKCWEGNNYITGFRGEIQTIKELSSLGCGEMVGEYIDKGKDISEVVLSVQREGLNEQMWIAFHDESSDLNKYLKSKMIERDFESMGDAFRTLRKEKDPVCSIPDEIRDCTAPFGAKIFLEEYYNNGKATKIMTSTHAHGATGSAILSYIQHKGLGTYGILPFVHLDANMDLRLNTHTRKPGTSDSIEEMIVGGLFMHKLKEADITDEEFIAVDVTRYLLKYQGISVEDIYEGNKSDSLTKKLDHFKKIRPKKAKHISKGYEIIKQVFYS
jgi:23S rRNA U2552 (ribose-2'-O)-methylase RlmE/FtsJ